MTLDVLSEFGWCDFFDAGFSRFRESGAQPGRVIAQQRDLLTVRTEAAVMRASIAGRLRHEARASELPVVGDWVALDAHGAAIVGRLPRQSVLTRKVPGARAVAQAVAANLNHVFVVMGLDEDFNLRRLERGLHIVWESGAQPTIVLNKADLRPDWRALQSEVETIACGAGVIVGSLMDAIPTRSPDLDGVRRVRATIQRGETAALIGSSGVGKSTLLNRLVGEDRLATQPVRASDGRGRHTTTHRELFLLEGGGMVIDNPGMREIQLWGSDESLDRAFAELGPLMATCRFVDCRHETEPGCGIRRALRDGELDPGRWESYLKLQRELAFVHRREDQGLLRQERDKWKKIHKEMRRRGHRRT